MTVLKKKVTRDSKKNNQIVFNNWTGIQSESSSFNTNVSHLNIIGNNISLNGRSGSNVQTRAGISGAADWHLRATGVRGPPVHAGTPRQWHGTGRSAESCGFAGSIRVNPSWTPNEC